MSTTLRSQKKLSFTGKQGKSKTKQYFEKTTNINHMMKKYKDINAPASPNQWDLAQQLAVQGTFKMDSDLSENLQIAKNIEKAWLKMPVETRTKFRNNPQAFISFVDDPANAEKCYQLGYKKRPMTVKYLNKERTHIIAEIPAGLNAEQRADAIANWQANNEPKPYTPPAE